MHSLHVCAMRSRQTKQVFSRSIPPQPILRLKHKTHYLSYHQHFISKLPIFSTLSQAIRHIKKTYRRQINHQLPNCVLFKHPLLNQRRELFGAQCKVSLLSKKQYATLKKISHCSGGSKGARGTPPGVQILPISCSFWEILAKSYVGAPPGGVGAHSSGKSWIRHCIGIKKTLQIIIHQVNDFTYL